MIETGSETVEIDRLDEGRQYQFQISGVWNGATVVLEEWSEAAGDYVAVRTFTANGLHRRFVMGNRARWSASSVGASTALAVEHVRLKDTRQVISSPLAASNPFSRIAAVGDSIIDAAGTATVFNQHFMSILHVLGGARTSPVLTAAGLPKFGASQQGTREIKLSFLDAVATNPKAQAVLILAGTNDYSQGRTASEVAETLGEMVDELLRQGKTPIVCDVLPLPSGQAAKSAWIVQVWAATAAMMIERPAAIHVQWASALDSNLDGVADSDGYFSDSVHPDLDGHYRLGIALHAALEPYMAPRDPFEGVEWLSPNPTMPGSPGPGLATGWNVDAGTGKTVTSTLIARGGSLGNWQQLAITGDAAVNTFFRYGFGTSSGGWVVGDVVRFLFEFETEDNLSAIFQVSPQLQTTISGSTAQRVNGFSGVAGTFTSLPRLPSGVIESPDYTLVTNTTAIWPYIPILGTGTIRIGRCGIRRVRAV